MQSPLFDLDAASNSEIEEDNNKTRRVINNLIKEINERTHGTNKMLNESTNLSSNELDDGILSNFNSKFCEEFRIANFIGNGKIGHVYSVVSRLDSRKYAIKRIAVNGSDDEIESVFDEIKAMARLHHTGIIRCYGTWMEKPPSDWQASANKGEWQKLSVNLPEINCNAFIHTQMQLCKYSLKEWLKSARTTDSRVIYRMKTWFKQMISAVGYLHGKSLMHRNLKPSNILFIEENVLTLSDIGITTEFGESEEAIMLETTKYRSPEQQSWRCSFPSDIFSLGLILVELCIVLTEEEAEKVFNNYREGRYSSILEHIPEVEKFVCLLTNVTAIERLDCRQILKHEFLNLIDLEEDPEQFLTKHALLDSLQSSIVPSGSQDRSLSLRNTEREQEVDLSSGCYEPNFLRRPYEPLESGEANSADTVSPFSWDSRSLDSSDGKEIQFNSNILSIKERRRINNQAVKRERILKEQEMKKESRQRTILPLVHLLAHQLSNAESQRIDGMNSEQDELAGFSSRFINDFTVNKMLAQDSFGCVFGSTNKIDGMNYAVRRIPVSDRQHDKTLQTLREIAKLDHCGIIRYYGMWCERPPEGWQYIADMELEKRINPSFDSNHRDIYLMNYPSNSLFIYFQMQIWNGSLAMWLSENKECRDLNKMKSWFSQITSAVAYLHMKELIHRDLKPINIVFTENDLLKICDFSIAVKQRVIDGVEEEDEQDMICNRLYKSPEQGSLFRTLTSKSDVFTLGLVLTEMVVVVDATERDEVFDNYRSGKRIELVEDGETREFLSWLTQVDPKTRPSCKEILEHSYLAKSTELSERIQKIFE